MDAREEVGGKGIRKETDVRELEELVFESNEQF